MFGVPESLKNMNAKKFKTCATHLVGSVPLDDSAAVFTLVESELGERLSRVPDGETGNRSNWIKWQYPVLANCPQLELETATQDNARSQIKIRSNVVPADIDLGPLGYCDAAIASYGEFSRLKQAGKISRESRFQVSLPTPLAPIQFFVAKECRADLELVYESRLLEELREIMKEIPHEELAIQWDTAVEFGILEGVFASHLDNAHQDILERLVRIGNAVPDSIELGYHLCYGDSNHKHFVEPKDATHLTTIANGLSDGLNRRIDWVHLPVPRERIDLEFFEPLSSLRLSTETELFLGLIHMTDGEEGARRRIQAASAFVEDFGIATECGFGRRPADSIADILKLHASVASAFDTSRNS